tara:strand:+ start:630 stop:1313 length:684 start_codon:yes stop_codon:yes gene_type:complete
MDPFTMMLIGGGMQAGMGILQAGAQGEAAQRSAQQQKDQIDHQNHIQKLQMAQKNRQIASANALKWMNNILLTEGAFKAQKEEELYIRQTFDNETGYLSNQAQAQNSQLSLELSTRNMTEGGTAVALKRAARIHMERTQEAREISEDNQLRDSERKMENILNTKRDYNYNQPIKYIPAVYLGQDPEAAGDAAYNLGMNQALMGGIQGGMAGHNMDLQQQYWKAAQTT